MGKDYEALGKDGSSKSSSSVYITFTTAATTTILTRWYIILTQILKYVVKH